MRGHKSYVHGDACKLEQTFARIVIETIACFECTTRYQPEVVLVRKHFVHRVARGDGCSEFRRQCHCFNANQPLCDHDRHCEDRDKFPRGRSRRCSTTSVAQWFVAGTPSEYRLFHRKFPACPAASPSAAGVTDTSWWTFGAYAEPEPGWRDDVLS